MTGSPARTNFKRWAPSLSCSFWGFIRPNASAVPVAAQSELPTRWGGLSRTTRTEMENGMARVLSLFTVLVVTWLLLSGHFNMLLITLGVLSSALVLTIAWRMRIIDAEGHPIHLFPGAVRYWLWLAWEIGKANLDVARQIVDPKLKIDPRVVRVPTSQRTGLGRAIYANSINLTPGTVSLTVTNHDIEVHALDAQTAEKLQQGEMDHRITRMEGRK